MSIAVKTNSITPPACWLGFVALNASILWRLVGELKHGREKNRNSLCRSSNLCGPLGELVSSFLGGLYWLLFWAWHCALPRVDGWVHFAVVEN
jgi:hypothetical protein